MNVFRDSHETSNQAMERTAEGAQMTAEAQLQNFIDKFKPEHQATIRATRKFLRRRFPTANELVYDNYNFFVIGFGPNERPSDCFISIAAAANGVGICFTHGASLPDPKKILSGTGKQRGFCGFLRSRCWRNWKWRSC